MVSRKVARVKARSGTRGNGCNHHVRGVGEGTAAHAKDGGTSQQRPVRDARAGNQHGPGDGSGAESHQAPTRGDVDEAGCNRLNSESHPVEHLGQHPDLHQAQPEDAAEYRRQHQPCTARQFVDEASGEGEDDGALSHRWVGIKPTQSDEADKAGCEQEFLLWTKTDKGRLAKEDRSPSSSLRHERYLMP